MHADMQAAARLQDRVCQHVAGQFRNLETNPIIRRALACGHLRLHGWVYLDPSGMILRYDSHSDRFTPLSEFAAVPLGAEVWPPDWPSM